MITQRIKGLAALHATAQAAASLILFWSCITLMLHSRDLPHSLNLERYASYSLLVVLGHFLDLVQTGSKRATLLDMDIVRNSRISFRQTLNVAFVLACYLVAVKDGYISRLFLFTWLPMQFVLFLITNRYLPEVIGRFVFDPRRRHRVLFAGASRHALKLKAWITRRRFYGFNPIGIVTSDEGEEDECCLPVFGKMEDLESIVLREQPSHLVLSELPAKAEMARNIATLCEKKGIRLLIVNDFAELLGQPVSMIEEDEFHVIGLRREPLESPFNRAVKRAFDIAISLIVVVLVLPAVAILVKLIQLWQSPGPLFYRQSRSGFNNDEFTILKFRTMHLNNEEARQATRDDVRVYPFGRLLRKLSLDELPQFINVLQGDMSIVGPRPHLLDHNNLFAEQSKHYQARSFIKPGITGLSQVRGFRGEMAERKLLMARINTDLYYLENWSIMLDALIVLRTVPHLLVPQSRAY
jgi:putative colanic acid biosynthesis UDP-glucose lipid carrier transferase